MSNKSFWSFVAGATVGAVATWLYSKNYFEKIIDDTRKKYAAADEEEQPPIPKKDDEDKTPEEKPEDDGEDEGEQPPATAYHKAVKEYEPEKNLEPYIITAEEFRDGAMAVNVTYQYYEDGVVTDEMDCIVEDAESILGEDFVDAFDEDDVCYVRNEERNCDYEIVRCGVDYYDESD